MASKTQWYWNVQTQVLTIASDKGVERFERVNENDVVTLGIGVQKSCLGYALVCQTAKVNDEVTEVLTLQKMKEAKVYDRAKPDEQHPSIRQLVDDVIKARPDPYANLYLRKFEAPSVN